MARCQLANVTRKPPWGDTAVHFPLSFLTHHLSMGFLTSLQEFLRNVIKLLPCDRHYPAADLDLDGVGAPAECFLELPLKFRVSLNRVDQFEHSLLGLADLL